MRKFLFYILAAMMLLSTLTGCDLFDQNPNTTVRTTATEEEFLAALDVTNYSVTGTASYCKDTGEKVETNTISAKVTGISCYRHQTSGFGADKTEKTDYYTIIDNVNYQITRTESGFVARQVTSGYADEGFGDVFGSDADPHAIYSSLTYHEQSKSYKGEYKPDDDSTYVITIAFADGKMTGANITHKSGALEISYSFYNFGATVVTLPEYTFAPNDSQ